MNHPAGGTTPSRGSARLATFVVEHIALLLPFIGAAIFYLRCVAVSRGDVATAFVLLSQTSIGDAIRALTFSLIPLVLLIGGFLSVLSVWDRVLRGEVRSLETVYLIVGSAVSLLVAFFFQGFGLAGATAAVLITMAILGIGILVHYLLAARLGPDLDAPRSIRFLLIATLVVSLGWFSLGSEFFWLPRERLVFRGEAPFTGYVLRTTGGVVVVFVDDPRIVIEKPEADLLDRRFCGRTEIEDQLIVRSLPRCP